MHTPQQGTTLFTGLLVLIAIGIIVQLWLLSAAVDAILRQHFDILIPAAVGSLLLFGMNGALVLFLFSFDKSMRCRADRR